MHNHLRTPIAVFFPKALLVTSVVALLGGCGSDESQLVPGVSTKQEPLHSAPSSSAGSVNPLSGVLSGEVFKSRHVQVNPQCGRYISATFNASGKAAGPYQGKFTAQGDWKAYLNWKVDKYEWYLNESFTISSGSSQTAGTISGTGFANPGRISCYNFKNRRFRNSKYQIQGGGRGHASIAGISNVYFRESFH